MYAGLILALPILLYQAYAFILPALSPTEKRTIVPFLLMVPVLFIMGVVFGYYVVLPAALKFLLNFNDTIFHTRSAPADYYSFVTLTLLAMGLVFQVPMGILAVVRLGIVTIEQLRKNRRYAYLILPSSRCCCPGTDPVTMLVELVPLLILYEISIVLARFFGEPRSGPRRRGRRRPRPERPQRRLIYSQAVLFDLRGKRKRMVQVVYVMLAAIFLLGFVGFGIGVGGGLGGIFDALGIGNGSSSSSTSAFTQQVQDAKAQVKKHPQDEKALLNLARYEYLSGQSELGRPDATTGQPVVTDDARWPSSTRRPTPGSGYVKVAKKPDPAVAGQIAFAYSSISDFGGAARAQQIVADAQPERQRLLPARHLQVREPRPQGRRRRRPEGRAGLARRQKKAAQKQVDSAREGREEVRPAAAGRQQGQRAEPRPGAPESLRRPCADLHGAHRSVSAGPRCPLATISPSGPLAQLVEQETLNLKVTGSIPVRPIASQQSGRSTGHCAVQCRVDVMPVAWFDVLPLRLGVRRSTHRLPCCSPCCWISVTWIRGRVDGASMRSRRSLFLSATSWSIV